MGRRIHAKFWFQTLKVRYHLENLRRIWKDDIKMGFTDEGSKDVDWVQQVRVDFCEHGNEPSES
jgi:hypothetical protein